MATDLVDKSALARLETSPEVGQTLDPLLIAGEVATCGMCDLEMLYSARSPQSYAAVATSLRALPRVQITESVVDRAGLTVLHYDADYERIAEITGQPEQWVVPRGSVD